MGKNTHTELTFNRWSDDSFPDMNQEVFILDLQNLIDQTLGKLPCLSPIDRAVLIEKILDFYDKKILHGPRFCGSIQASSEKNLFELIMEILSLGFNGENIPFRFLKDAPNVEILEAMLKAGADPKSEFGIEALESFAYGYQDGRFEKLLEAGASTCLVNDNGSYREPLLFRHNLLKIYECGADLNVLDKDGNNPLFFYRCDNSFGGWGKYGKHKGVYRDSYTEIIQLFKKSGCDLNHVNNFGETALSKTLNDNSYAFDYFADLIRAGARVHCPPNPEPLLIRLSRNKFSDFPGVVEFIDLLLEKKVSPDEIDPHSGNTALHLWAGMDGEFSRKVCEKLIKVGANVHALNNEGQTPLMYAAQHHAGKSWKFLLSKKADINARSANGYSVSEWSVAFGGAPPDGFLKLLLETGAPLDGAEVNCDISLLGFLIENSHYHAALKVIEHGAMINDWVIETMFRQNGGDLEAALLAVAKFIQTFGAKAKGALCSDHAEAVERMLAESSPISDTFCPLEKSAAKGWPPVFPRRQQIVVPNIVGEKLAPELNFTGEEKSVYQEYEKVFLEWKESNKREKKLKNARQENTYDYLSKKHEYIFNVLLLAENEALIKLWDDILVKELSKFHSSYQFPTYFNPGQFSGGLLSKRELNYILWRCGLSCLEGMLKLSNKKENLISRVLFPVADTRIAPLMASRLSRTPVARLARKWFLRHPKHAIHGLIPIAVGTLGKQRDQCEAALRYMASQGLEKEILSIAKSYNEEVLSTVNEILSVDPCADYHAGSAVHIPEFIFDADLNLPLDKKTGKPPGKNALFVLLGMMSVSTYDDIYPALKEILPTLDETSLADFAWSIFRVWNDWNPKWSDNQGKKNKKEAEWMYHCLGYMGNNDTIKKLRPFINSWPKEGGMPKAVTGLDIIANIGSDFAIRTINAILLKTKYKPILERAEEIMETIADVRGLTKDQLEDRLVPSFGLDEPAAFTLDFGDRAFTIRIDEKLVPTLVDADGKTIKSLPIASKTDDKAKVKEATDFWKALKADLKAEASTQLIRFEQAMIAGRLWSGSDFKDFLVNHPVLRFLIHRLIWADILDQKKPKTFRVDELGNFYDASGTRVTIQDSSTICLPHPLQIQKELDTWKDVLTRNKIKQPFAQITRQFYLKNDDVNNDHFGLNGAIAPAKAFRSLKSKGWIGEIGSAGQFWGFEKPMSNGKFQIDFSGVVTMRDIGMDEDLRLEVSVSGKPTDVEYSEAIREIKELLY